MPIIQKIQKSEASLYTYVVPFLVWEKTHFSTLLLLGLIKKEKKIFDKEKQDIAVNKTNMIS